MNEIETQGISCADVADRVDRNDVFLLDVRGSKGRTQIYGAISYDPDKLLSAERLVLPLPKSEGLIVLYDEADDSKHLEKLAAKLRADGYGTVRRLEGGFRAWSAACGKTEDITIEQPVPLVSEHQLER